MRQWLALADSPLQQVLADGIWRGERELLSGVGPVPVEVSITTVMASDGRRHCFLVALHDLRERRLAEERLQRMAMVDELTGLPNRLTTQLRIDEALAHAAQFGILFIDLDGFKEINDCYGHDHGDVLLAAVGARLRKSLPEDVLLARWGSDEFILLLPSGSGDTEVRSAAQVVLASLAVRFEIGLHEVRLTPTIGAVLAPQDGCELNILLRKADSAMVAGKERGRNCLVFFDNSLDNDVQRRVRMISLLRVDTDRNGFRFVAPPKVDALGACRAWGVASEKRPQRGQFLPDLQAHSSTMGQKAGKNWTAEAVSEPTIPKSDRLLGRPVGAELLMRWTTEAFGSVSPVEFIPLAE